MAHQGVVFVTDDEDALRDSTQELLEDAGYLVLGARSGAEALARMRGITGPAVAVVDLVMPGMNGFDLIVAMRASAELKRIPIIVLSAQTRESIQGADRIIRKPFKSAELLEAVRGLCR